MKEKELSTRMKNLHHLTRLAVKYELTIPKLVFESKSFIEQEKALYGLKYDSGLEVFKREEGDYIILTFVMNSSLELLK